MSFEQPDITAGHGFCGHFLRQDGDEEGIDCTDVGVYGKGSFEFQNESFVGEFPVAAYALGLPFGCVKKMDFKCFAGKYPFHISGEGAAQKGDTGEGAAPGATQVGFFHAGGRIFSTGRSQDEKDNVEEMRFGGGLEVHEGGA